MGLDLATKILLALAVTANVGIWALYVRGIEPPHQYVICGGDNNTINPGKLSGIGFGNDNWTDAGAK